MEVKKALIALLIGSILALGYALIRAGWIFRQEVKEDRLKQIGGFVSEGAMAFLNREYRVLLPFVILIAAFLAIGNSGALRLQSVSFILGAVASALSGYIGMKVATAANSRTTQAASDKGLNAALRVAFSGGSVMGMSVVGLAMLGLFIVLYVATLLFGTGVDALSSTILPIVTGFSLGASSIALFSRVGGGIFTKAADVGADLVGKVEAGIPEDDPRNPATIADNVGDNVGDVAGMGADLFESFVGSIAGAMILGLTVAADDAVKIKLMILPLLLVTVGLVASLIGTLFVRTRPGSSPQKALNAGTFGAAGIAAVFVFIVLKFYIGGDLFNGGSGIYHIFGASIIGLVAGAVIGLVTEYFTGTDTRPVTAIMKSCETGAATTLITGMGVGMLSAFPAIVIIGAAIWCSFALAGLYGIGIAAVGMLVTLGIQLSVDAYGPIADNAGGLAEMSEFPPAVRDITDSLDAVGNTTAAIGKGFAIGSAALTAIILFTSFKTQSGIDVVDLTSVPVLVGILLGAVIPYLFSSMAMSAVGRAAYKMIEEVRRQFREKPGILTEDETPDYKRCVDISTQAALREMMLPGIVSVVTPVIIGFTGGPGMLIGLLTGVTASGVVLAIFMSNAGGAWDNAKKMIESGGSGGKGSEAHKAAVVGDTVGDPFKDTAGPSINILIKLMSMVSLVIAPMLKSFWG
ncbi:MAG: sodium-translocating pyrophosphatase [Spirochaetales bacterium]|uniref:Putative K(+)-stimulated pyrophosphate-energized sodium pump n=1 Tax=Candidatus Thalassospirochaeta sargassi TaxID=3119039 RepID=A0AAJ1IKB3_9SPIO|nr:sodium-translocating pyrophosphatase [Spirochaetales bacterium]